MVSASVCTSKSVAAAAATSKSASLFRRRLSSHFIPLVHSGWGKSKSPTGAREAHAHGGGEETVISQQLLIQGGYIRPTSSSGLFNVLPLGVRVLNKIMGIIDVHLEEAGCSKTMLPSLTPKEIMKQTGRWDSIGGEMFRLQDRREREFCLAPTCEEAVTSLVQMCSVGHPLPLRLYQFTTKFRDEIRPRFGLLRSREFIMKDLYTFDATIEACRDGYAKITEAYARIFKDIGLPVRRVLADSGNIGGEISHEYHLCVESGEDTLLECPSCGGLANVEIARGGLEEGEEQSAGNVDVDDPVLIVQGEGQACVGFIRKGEAFNPLQLGKVLGTSCEVLTSLSEEQIKKKIEGLGTVRVVVDDSVKHLKVKGKVAQAVAGTEKDVLPDSLRVLAGAVGKDGGLSGDFIGLVSGDFRLAKEGDLCRSEQCVSARDGGRKNEDVSPSVLHERRGLELGHTFILGQKYSAPMKLTASPGAGQSPVPLEMACFGIGVTRVFQAIAEYSHDEGGIIWPASVAPFKVCIFLSGRKNQREIVDNIGEKIYDSLTSSFPHWRDDIVIDDRFLKANGFKAAVALGSPVIVSVDHRDVLRCTSGESDDKVAFIHRRGHASKGKAGPFSLAELPMRLSEMQLE
eukprot:Nk52_evm6s168 gene=Nk52_evmTU6s168